MCVCGGGILQAQQAPWVILEAPPICLQAQAGDFLGPGEGQEQQGLRGIRAIKGWSHACIFREWGLEPQVSHESLEAQVPF